jgi:hypothetical protein
MTDPLTGEQRRIYAQRPQTQLEWKPTTSFTQRAELNNFDPYRFTISRFVFDQPRDPGVLDVVDKELRKSQITGILRARWTFDQIALPANRSQQSPFCRIRC